MSINTRLLLALAAVLITNSHLEAFYPTPLLAGDGLLGNSIFFMVAGLGITLSARHGLRSFPRYYWRRIKRIYPTVLLAVTAFIFIPQRGWTNWSWRDAVTNYIWPTPWAFIEFVMVLYVVFYLLLLRASAALFGSLFFLMFVPFGICWYLHPQETARLGLGLLDPSIYWVFFFQMMLLGGYLACRTDAQGRGRLALLFLILACVLYLGFKVLFVTGRIGGFHFLLFPVVQLIVILLVPLTGSDVVHRLLTSPWFNRPVEWIGTRTLEIYVIQGFLAYRDDLAHLAFPLNIVAFWAILLLVAALTHALVSLVVRERGARPAVV